MKTIIAGSRTIHVYDHVVQAMEHCPWTNRITEVISGCALGVDRLGERWAEEHNIPIKQFFITRQEWNRLGKKAGPLRNQKMADYADALVAIYDGTSTGTADMIDRAKKKGLRLFVWHVGLDKEWHQVSDETKSF